MNIHKVKKNKIRLSGMCGKRKWGCLLHILLWH